MQHFKPIKPILLAGFFSLSMASCHKEKVATGISQTDIPTTQSTVTTTTVAYLLGGNKVNTHTAQIRQKIADLGATETAYLPNFKMMAVRSAHPQFKTELEALNVHVSLDFQVVKSASQAQIRTLSVANSATNPFFPIQWNLKAIEAPAAWALGYRGQGVRVAVVDDGFFLNHPDLTANFNHTLGRNFVQLSGENPLDVTPYSTGFSHGTHVSGIIAAADNTEGIVGVAPQAELLPLKVFGAQGEAQISWIAQAIVYAADQGAKVINLSLGGIVLKGSGSFATGTQFGIALYHQAIQYAATQGATVICAAGNDALDFDHTGSLEVFPSGSPHALCISATSPSNWLPTVVSNLDIPTSYTNFGTSRIDFAAPGGDFDVPGELYDGIYSPGDATNYYFVAGTSQAAPHVTGVVALMIGKNGGSMSPAHVKTKLRQSADDLGSNGKDKYFGYGRVNALKAVQ
jgi:subtilisin family serine protease